MEHEILVFREEKLVFVRYKDRVTFPELTQAVKTSLNRPDWLYDYNLLIDFTDVTWDISSDEVNKIAQAHPRNDHVRKMAIVVSGSLGYGMGRMYQGMSEHTNRWDQLQLFESMEEAREWLGVGDLVATEAEHFN